MAKVKCSFLSNTIESAQMLYADQSSSYSSAAVLLLFTFFNVLKRIGMKRRCVNNPNNFFLYLLQLCRSKAVSQTSFVKNGYFGVKIGNQDRFSCTRCTDTYRCKRYRKCNFVRLKYISFRLSDSDFNLHASNHQHFYIFSAYTSKDK